MHWRIRCGQLETHCQDLQKALSEEKNNQQKELENKYELNESLAAAAAAVTSNSWIQSELKSAKNTIRQLRALVQAKQDKIDILEQMKQIQVPNRNR